MAGENLGTEMQAEDNSQGTEAQDGGSQGQETQGLLDGGANVSQNASDGDTGNGSSDESSTGAEVSHEAEDAFKTQLAERDAEIAKLKGEIAEAAKSAEATDKLNARIAELEAKAETERVEFELKLAGCRSTRAARALLDEHDGDIAKLKEAEPWLFDTGTDVSYGATGLPNAGTANTDDSTIAHWREIAGLTDSDS